MLSKQPLQSICQQKLEGKQLAEALRYAIVAELDAINLYLQFARCSGDEAARKLFEDIAREEKTHVGEFMELLARLDPEQVRELTEGSKEAAEIIGGEPVLAATEVGGSKLQASRQSNSSQHSSSTVEQLVGKAFLELLDSARRLRPLLPTTRVGEGVDAVAIPRYEVKGGEVVSVWAGVKPVESIHVDIVLTQQDLDRIRRIGAVDTPAVGAAAARMAMEEDRLIVETLTSEAAVKLPLGDWSGPDEPVEKVAEAVARIEEEGAAPPYILLLNPKLYTRLLRVHDGMGVTVLARIKRMAKVVYTPVVPENRAILFSANPATLDVVEATSPKIEYVGVEAGGLHRFRAWEHLVVRVLNPKRIVVLEA